MSPANHKIYLAAAESNNSGARAITRSAYARLAMAFTLDLDDGLQDFWRRAADKPTPETETLALPSRFLRAAARAVVFAFSANAAFSLEQARIARERAELRYGYRRLRFY